MQDSAGRIITYLRLSVTDLCNFRCRYCMDAEGVPKLQHGQILSVEELAEIAQAAVHCGVRKIRLTGGEPLVRRGIVTLCQMLRDIPDLEELTMTTNGSLLPDFAQDLRAAGVDRLNVSLDTLQPEKFSKISRGGSLAQVMQGLQAAQDAGFPPPKRNVVLLGGVNTQEIPAFVALTKTQPCCVRFIELMPMGVCAQWPKEYFVPAQTVLDTCTDLQYIGTQGVAELYQVPGYAGTVGLIRPMSGCFCSRCSRIRVTADGMLKPCLHAKLELPLRGLHGQALEQAILAGIQAKPPAHCLTQNMHSAAGRQMHEIGG